MLLTIFTFSCSDNQSDNDNADDFIINLIRKTERFNEKELGKKIDLPSEILAKIDSNENFEKLVIIVTKRSDCVTCRRIVYKIGSRIEKLNDGPSMVYVVGNGLDQFTEEVN